MNVDGKNIRPIWFDDKSQSVKVIDQRLLPHKLIFAELRTVDDIIYAIKNMLVRGAPLIGAAGSFGVYNALINIKENLKISDKDIKNHIQKECQRVKDARPTAVNLEWGVNRALKALNYDNYDDMVMEALKEASKIVEEEAENCRLIGQYGCSLIEEIANNKIKYGRQNNPTVNILTHCNAGWLAAIEYGTATAPIYTAFDKGIDIHVWVDETRPLNQGSRLTAWELGKHGIAHTIITDNAGGHLMQHGMVDIVIVGTDRTTKTGDVANKIGTYLKALAANDNGVPFYVALPSSTFDWSLKDGVDEIPIEERNPDEIKFIQGIDNNGNISSVMVTPQFSPAINHAFDVTPARLITGFITERGICKASEESILSLFPDKLHIINNN